MLSTNVLCMKKRKKRSYYISEASDYIPRPSKDKRSVGDRNPAMMQITEDTPPDMLAGAMDLTVHLPTGRTVKMSVERSTPMMDLLVQITTGHHLQHSGHILQALEMAPTTTSGHTDKILPYKPNTPIGALDTQHVKVIPKNRSIPVSKNVSVGHQPFESTFRLQVHLPRNQLYVIRVSQNVYLEDIMKKVCDEKNLDSLKYEFRHPGNLDEVLDPKLTLSDYQITEVYIVGKGTVGLSQAFSSNDIMALKKEEERKQLQARTGGGVFSLIFKRGKTSMGSGSLSSENRSISPSHSDDSRSVTPPAIQQQILAPISQEIPQTAPDKPKPPQRKRRPAPKPPQNQQQENRKDSTDKPPSQISNTSETNMSDLQQKKIDNGLTICHSRNSSDSSGYHEPSVLSDNCNTSLPRRPKSTIINEVVSEEVQAGDHYKTNGNLSKMAAFSKSTTSITNRKKKAAPPPPPPPAAISSVAVSKVENSLSPSPEKPSPVVASPPHVEKQASPMPTPRIKNASETPKPAPRVKPVVVENPVPQARRSSGSKPSAPLPPPRQLQQLEDDVAVSPASSSITTTTTSTTSTPIIITNDRQFILTNHDDGEPIEVISSTNKELIENIIENEKNENTLVDSINPTLVETFESTHALVSDDDSEIKSETLENDSKKPPEVVAVIPKAIESEANLLSFDTIDNTNEDFEMGSSTLKFNIDEDKKSLNSIEVDERNPPGEDSEINDFSVSATDSEVILEKSNASKITQELPGTEMTKNRSIISLRNSESTPAFLEQSNIKKWNNVQDLDHISLESDSAGFGDSRWVVGDISDTDSISTAPVAKQSSRENISSPQVTSCPEPNVIVPESNNTKVPESPRGSVSSSSTTPPRKDSKSSPPVYSTPTEEQINKQSPRRSLTSEEKPALPIQGPSSSPKVQETPSPNSFPQLDTKVQESNPEIVPSKPVNPQKDETVDGVLGKPAQLEEIENDWQYQLPPPPTAFRDSSPTNLTDITNYDTVTLQDFKEESVITNPELFEKLRLVKENRFETETNSDYNSVISDEKEPMLNKLTLENLEKRKSLVYNRELSTSLKVAQESSSVNKSINDDTSSKRSSVLSELEEVIQNGKTLTKQKSVVSPPVAVDSNLPNFKISTYDNPKRKINIFEDDSVRSNVDVPLKLNSFVELSNSGNSGNFFSTTGQSVENTTPYKKSDTEEQYDDDGFKKPQEFNKYKIVSRNNFYVKHQPEPSLNHVTRSESFSSNHNVPHWKPLNPVQRSKSQVALNMKPDTKTDSEDSLTKYNSLFDVSGLQSLEVMRMIQTKLKTPRNSIEQLPELTNIQDTTQPPKSESESTTNDTKTYKYRGPPAINLSTWSERPKMKVSLKEDTDYKIKSNGNVEVRHYNGSDSNNVTIKINGTEPITTQESGNVVIKIGESQVSKVAEKFSSKFINNTTTSGYRKPLANINKNDNIQRPHSVAFDSDFDISRVPIVRAVELKKPFKETNNTSVTQITPSNNSNNKYADIYRSSEAVNEVNGLKPHSQSQAKNSSVYLSSETTTKPVIRVNSFAQHRTAPVVMGFRGAEIGNDNTARSRKSWNVSNSYGTLPLKVPPEPPTKVTNFIPNSNVPFSKNSLKRADSNKVVVVNENGNGVSNNIFGNVVLRNTSTQIKNNCNNRYSTGSQFIVKNNFETQEASQPPPPPVMPKIAGVMRKPIQTTPPASLDSRDELLNSIRNFGGKRGLRHVKV